MQAVILAAGMGRRLGDLTKDNTKCMLRVNGETLIDRMLSQLLKLEIDKIIIVVGYASENLISHINNNFSNNPKIEYVLNPIYDKTNNIYSLYLAKNYLPLDETIIIESDLIVEDSIFDLIINSEHPNVVLIDKYETWMDGTMVTINEETNDIMCFIPKNAFKYSDVSEYYKTVNITKLSKEFSANLYIPLLDAYIKSMGNNEYYEQVLRVISMLDKSNLKALTLNGEKWYEIDDIHDKSVAETIFGEGDVKLKNYCNRFGGYWRFPKLLDYCYLVNPYFPTRKMKDEMRSNFDILLTEYPSGLSVNNLLIGKCFDIKSDYCCIGNGAAELIKSLMSIFSGRIGIIFPSFEEYSNRFIGEDKTIVGFTPSNKNFSYSCKDLIDFYSDKDINYLLLINPDNPSGNMIPKEDVIYLTKWCNKKNITIVLDESFVDFSNEGHINSCLDNNLLEDNNNLIVIKSISKSFGVPGLRLGFVASSNKEIIDSLRKDVSIWNINSFAEFYLQIYNKYANDYILACVSFCKERKRFYEELQKISFIRVIPSQANYFLCEVIGKYTSTELTKKLIEYNILIKDCSSKKIFNGRNYIRIAVRNKNDNNRLLSFLKEIE